MSKTRIVQGGIYKYQEQEGEALKDYYAMYFQGNLYFILDHMFCLDADVECTSNLDEFELVEGYALASVKTAENSYEWQIRNSGMKHHKDYIIARGPAGVRFMNQVDKLSKSF